MRSRYLFAICSLFLGMFLPALKAGTYALADGQTVIGEPISYNETGLIVRQNDGNVSQRTPWTKFTQAALKQIAAEAKSDKDREFVKVFIEEEVQEQAKRKEIIIKEMEPPARPKGHLGLGAAFSSPVFVLIFLVLYAANIYAAFEIAFFKNQPAWMVCGLSAIAPVIGPIVFIAIPGRRDINPQTMITTDAPAPLVEEVILAREAAAAEEAATAAALAEESAAATPAFPEPIVFRRGEFSFNRRFFETKFAGFLRLVPGEAEKDLILAVKSLRGNFVAKRITRVTQEEVYFQAFKDAATHDEMVPYMEINEVVIRHKDAA